MIKKGLFIAFLLIVGHVYTGPVRAQSMRLMDLEVSPSTSYIKLKPGSSTTHTVTLENLGTHHLTISPEIVDFKPNGETGVPVIEQSLSFPYLEIPETGFGSLELEAKQTAQLTLRMTAPAGAKEQEYPLTILFHQQSPIANASSNLDTSQAKTQVSGSIGSNLIVLVSDQDLDPQLQVKSINSPWLVDTLGSMEFTPVLENQLVSAAVASGSASVSNWQGKKLATWQIFPDVVLGGSTRNAQAIIQLPGNVPKPGKFKLKTKLWGPFTLTVNTTHLDSNDSLITDSSQTKLFFALPYKPILGLAGLIFIAWIIKILRRSIFHKSRLS